MFFMENYFPDHFPEYPDRYTRLLDVYTGILIYISMSLALMVSARNFLENERLKAQKSDRLKSAFLANMSHEIRTPMNAVVGFSQLLEKVSSDEKKAGYVRIIKDNSLYLLQLIDDIIDISKIEANQFDIIPSYFSVNEFLIEVKVLILAYLEKIGKSNLKYIENFEPMGHMIYCDRTRLKQILVNLLTNAAKFTKEGSISIKFEIHTKEIIFHIEDTGIGIKPENQTEIFDRFFKIDPDKSASFVQGTGIGLSITKKIIELMGGEVTLTSIYGKGTNFTFRIPLENDSFSIKTVADKTDERDDFNSEVILIVEDEDSNYQYLFELLVVFNLQIIRAKSGPEAVSICNRVQSVRLVLMDMKIPEMDGITATMEIKKLRPDLPVIAQTAYAMGADFQRFLGSGCDDYISKPILPEHLIGKLKKYLI
jgi:signal transduction histidine kinase/CheY-like chemotaxis protein